MGEDLDMEDIANEIDYEPSKAEYREAFWEYLEEFYDGDTDYS